LREQKFITLDGNLLLTKRGANYSKYGRWFRLYENFIFQNAVTATVSAGVGFLFGLFF